MGFIEDLEWIDSEVYDYWGYCDECNADILCDNYGNHPDISKLIDLFRELKTNQGMKTSKDPAINEWDIEILKSIIARL